MANFQLLAVEKAPAKVANPIGWYVKKELIFHYNLELYNYLTPINSPFSFDFSPNKTFQKQSPQKLLIFLLTVDNLLIFSDLTNQKN
ncbi:hypothetical protein [Rufibacter tibetensis]|uniref:Uncharacterized protein n=1 Tax=Rufibacter tibetensis TaxID=512763 RepID=A0A0N7HW24_9BACT|nr:hypothetical protein [Rufibacter tibetensis]ALI98056.1 hypothetical protein DC20_02535 [Rufibacter tibetensis]